MMDQYYKRWTSVTLGQHFVLAVRHLLLVNNEYAYMSYLFIRAHQNIALFECGGSCHHPLSLYKCGASDYEWGLRPPSSIIIMIILVGYQAQATILYRITMYEWGLRPLFSIIMYEWGLRRPFSITIYEWGHRLPSSITMTGDRMLCSQEEYASYGPTGESGVQTFFDA